MKAFLSLSFLDCNSFGFLILEAKMDNSDIKKYLLEIMRSIYH